MTIIYATSIIIKSRGARGNALREEEVEGQEMEYKKKSTVTVIGVARKQLDVNKYIVLFIINAKDLKTACCEYKSQQNCHSQAT